MVEMVFSYEGLGLMTWDAVLAQDYALLQALFLLMALGGCTSVDVVGILRKKRQQLTGLTVRVSGEQDADPPWTFRRIHVEYEVRGRDLRPRAVEQAVALSEEKYCSVRATLEGKVELTREIRIVEE